MNYSITTLGKKTIAGFHLVGPWDHTVKQGFEQMMMWVENHQVPAREWVAVYYDNPEEVPAEKLRCATAVTVDEDYVIPANSEGVILAAIAGGDYACARARVVDYDFATPWMQFFDSLQQSTAYRIAPQPCFEVYLNDGNHDGYWDIDMYVPVERVAS
ncbi:TPA: DNA gyrase inhibitor SbmC [Klebsiella pneumoniae]|nr:DNA gyrase inhibitor SbmC [Klebsiella pneumoniae]